MSGGTKWAEFEDATLAKGFAQIPNAIMRASALSMQAKYLYGLLLSYAWQDSHAHPGVERLCKDAGVSKDTLGKYLKELKDANLIEVRRRGLGKTNVYVFKSISSFQDGEMGSAPDSDTGSHQDGDTGSNKEYAEYEYAVDEDAEKDTPSGEPKESASAADDGEIGKDGSTGEVKPWEYGEMLRHALKDSDVPLTRSRERRYVREFRLLMERGVDPEECDEALDRIVSEWERVQLTVDMALRDCRTGRQTNGKTSTPSVGISATGSDSATPVEVIEYVFQNTKTESIRNNEASIRRAMQKHDFTSGAEPPFPVAKMLGGSENERWQIQDALDALCRRAVKEHAA